MRCRITDAYMTAVQGGSISAAMVVKAEAERKAGEDVELSKNGVFNFNAFNQSNFANVFNTILFPVSEEHVNVLVALCEDNEGLEEDAKTFPLIDLVSVSVKAPEKYIQTWSRDDEELKHVQGEPVCDDEGKVRIFEEIKVICLCDENEKPTEDVNRKARQRWKSNLLNGVFVTLSDYEASIAETKAVEEVKVQDKLNENEFAAAPKLNKNGNGGNGKGTTTGNNRPGFGRR